MSFTHNTAPTQFIEIGKVRYAYRRFGTEIGTPAVFLAHFRAGLDNWDPEITDGLAQDRPVVLFNNAGVASSGGEPDDSVPAMAKNAVAFIKAIGLDQVDLVGFSLGGFVAQQITTDNPALVRRIILAGTGPQGGEQMAEYSPVVAKYSVSEVLTIDNYLHLFFSASEKSQAAGRAFWERRHRRADQDVPSSMAAMAAQASAIANWGAVPKQDRYAQLKKIKQPVLVVNGNNDIVVPTINSIILYQNLPDAKLLLYPDSGHGSIFQFSIDFVAQAQLFLDS